MLGGDPQSAQIKPAGLTLHAGMMDSGNSDCPSCLHQRRDDRESDNPKADFLNSLASSMQAMNNLTSTSGKTNHVAAASGSVYLSEQTDFRQIQIEIVIL